MLPYRLVHRIIAVATLCYCIGCMCWMGWLV